MDKLDKLKTVLSDELDKAAADVKAGMQKKFGKLAEQMKAAKSKQEVVHLLKVATAEMTKTTELLEKAKTTKARLKAMPPQTD